MTTRPWMPLYIADYLSKTTHLGALQSGAYLHLIMDYWQNRGLPATDQALARIARLTASEWKREKSVIQAFFYDGWQHKRIDEELAHADEIASKRRAAAEQRYNKSAAKADAIAPANAEHVDTQSTVHIPPTEEIIAPPTEAPPNKPKTDDVREAVAIYAQVALREETGWPSVQRLTSARISACRARLAEAGGIEGWRAAMERAARSGFLCGRNENGWRADFDFFCQSKSFTKLMEGSYDDRTGTGPNGKTGAHDTIFGALAKVAAQRSGIDWRSADAGDGVVGEPGPAEADFERNRALEIPDYLRRSA